MKESDITPEVIRLSKEIAEHWRMEIYKGCWAWFCPYDETEEVGLIQWTDGDAFYTDGPKWPNIMTIPIPSISDCLEKLRELGIEPDISIDANGNTYLKYGDPLQMTLHNSLHEALLSALLEEVRE